MRHAEEAGGPLTVELADGTTLSALAIDGGGAFVGEHPVTGEPGFLMYEVHGRYPDGEFLCICQRDISRVTTADGEEVEFGNPFMPGHPRFEG